MSNTSVNAGLLCSPCNMLPSTFFYQCSCLRDSSRLFDVVESHRISFLLQASAPGACRPRFNYSGGQVLGGVDQQTGLDRWKLVKVEEEVGVGSCSTSLELVRRFFLPACWYWYKSMLFHAHLTKSFEVSNMLFSVIHVVYLREGCCCTRPRVGDAALVLLWMKIFPSLIILPRTC